MPWKAKKEYMRTKYESTEKRIYESNWDSIVAFWIVGLRTNHNKTFKCHLEGTEAAVYYGYKKFSVEAMSIRFTLASVEFTDIQFFHKKSKWVNIG